LYVLATSLWCLYVSSPPLHSVPWPKPLGARPRFGAGEGARTPRDPPLPAFSLPLSSPLGAWPGGFWGAGSSSALSGPPPPLAFCSLAGDLPGFSMPGPIRGGGLRSYSCQVPARIESLPALPFPFQAPRGLAAVRGRGWGAEFRVTLPSPPFLSPVLAPRGPAGGVIGRGGVLSRLLASRPLAFCSLAGDPSGFSMPGLSRGGGLRTRLHIWGIAWM
jgi:hypothetical protein